MTFDKDQFKTIKGVFVSANEMYYRCDFAYSKSEQGEISYKVVIESANNDLTELQFIWNEQEQFWQCKHPEQLSIQLLQAITEKIGQIEQIK
jgi:hypothetical protein